MQVSEEVARESVLALLREEGIPRRFLSQGKYIEGIWVFDWEIFPHGYIRFYVSRDNGTILSIDDHINK